MPELPEVETVCQALKPVLEGRYIKDICLNRPDLRYPLPLQMKEKICGQIIIAINRRAKYILINFTNRLTLIWHLGMSGRAIINDALNNPCNTGKHDHVIFTTSHDDTIVFRDPRRFGFLLLADSNQMGHISPFDKLGPEPFDETLTAESFHARLVRRSVTLKNALLNQHVIAGLGNIYVSEALWQAKLSPLRLAGTLNVAEAGTLLHQIRDVLGRAIASGGSTLRDHIQPNGETGYFQHHFKVYDRKEQPCQHCQVTLLARIVQGGRSTYYCSQCQI